MAARLSQELHELVRRYDVTKHDDVCMRVSDVMVTLLYLGRYERMTRSSSSSDFSSRDVQMFVARFCDLLDVEITCDGCNNTLPGQRYRCLQCPDMDLCSTCYAGASLLTFHHLVI